MPSPVALNAPVAHILSLAIGGHNHRTCMGDHVLPHQLLPTSDPASDSYRAVAYLCASRAKRRASQRICTAAAVLCR